MGNCPLRLPAAVFIAAFMLITVSGCTSYRFTSASLVAQLPEVETETQADTIAFDNHLQKIKVTKHNGEEVELKVTKYMAVRMKNNKHEHKRAMLTTMYVQDGLLCGYKSRSDKEPIKPLRITGITKLKLLH